MLPFRFVCPGGKRWGDGKIQKSLAYKRITLMENSCHTFGDDHDIKCKSTQLIIEPKIKVPNELLEPGPVGGY